MSPPPVITSLALPVLALLLLALLLAPSLTTATATSTIPLADSDTFQCPPCPPPSATRFAYLVSVHDDRTVQDAVPLLKSISAPNNIVLVHVDLKYPKEFYAGSELSRIVEDCECG